MFTYLDDIYIYIYTYIYIYIIYIYIYIYIYNIYMYTYIWRVKRGWGEIRGAVGADIFKFYF